MEEHLGAFFCDWPSTPHGPFWAPDIWVVMMLVGAFCFPRLFLAGFREIQICERSEALAYDAKPPMKAGRYSQALDAKHFYNRRSPDTTPLVGSAHSKPLKDTRAPCSSRMGCLQRFGYGGRGLL